MKKILRENQVADLAYYMADGNEKCMNLSDAGTGKTGSVCVRIYQLAEDSVKTAWSMPKSLLKKNKDELIEFTNLEPDQIVIVDGTPQQRLEQIKRPAEVYLMGFQRWSDDWETICEYQPRIRHLPVDEIHLGYKGPESKRTAGFWRSMRKMDFGIFMTGTLVSGKLETAYPAIHAIEPRYYFDHTDFLNQHTIRDIWGNIISWTGHEKIAAILGRHGIRRSFESVYGKEAVIYQIERCEMSPSQLRAYKEFEEKGIVELEKSFLESKPGGVHLMRCRQIMQAPELFDGLMKKGELTGKDERLLIHFAENKPLALFSVFQAEHQRLYDLALKFGRKPVIINGNVSARKRAEADEGFRKGIYDTMIASPATAGIGYNWEHCDHVIFVSLDYLDDTFLQARRRFSRGTRKTPLRVGEVTFVYVLRREEVPCRSVFVDAKMQRAVKVIEETTGKDARDVADDLRARLRIGDQAVECEARLEAPLSIRDRCIAPLRRLINIPLVEVDREVSVETVLRIHHKVVEHPSRVGRPLELERTVPSA